MTLIKLNTIPKPKNTYIRVPGQAKAAVNYTKLLDDPYIEIDFYRRQALFIRYDIDRTKPWLRLKRETTMRIKELVKLHLKHTSKRISTVFSYWANPGCSDGMIKIPKDVGNAFLSDFAELLLDVASYEKKPFADELYARHFGANPDPQISH